MKLKRIGNYARGKRSPSYKHGMHGTPTWTSWSAMRYRATSSNRERDIPYRIVGMCERWEEFNNFYEDMGERPLNMTIERLDNSKGYYKENCKWATRSEQNINKRYGDKPNKHGLRGVKSYPRGSGGKFFAAVCRGKFIGYFFTKEEAALAYNEKARELFGTNATLNKVEE